MRVYIELVIADNFAITYLLAKLSYFFLGMPSAKVRILIGSFVGALASLCYPFIALPLLSVGYKVLCGAVIILALFPPKKLLKGGLTFLLFTGAFGGAMFAVGYFAHGSVADALTKPLASFPIGAAVLCSYFVFVALKALIMRTKKKRDVERFIYEANVGVFGINIKCKAFLDSGNRLYDDSSGLPIVIISMATLAKALSDEHMSQLMTGKTGSFKDAHYVSYSTVSGKSKMFVFRPDELVVYEEDKKNIINDVMLGVVFKRVADAESYGMILNPAVMTGV